MEQGRLTWLQASFSASKISTKSFMLYRKWSRSSMPLSLLVDTSERMARYDIQPSICLQLSRSSSLTTIQSQWHFFCKRAHVERHLSSPRLDRRTCRFFLPCRGFCCQRMVSIVWKLIVFGDKRQECPCVTNHIVFVTVVADSYAWTGDDAATKWCSYNKVCSRLSTIEDAFCNILAI